jgi:thioredoxin reductase (NADPH)
LVPASPKKDGFWAQIGHVGEVCARAVVISSGVTYRRLGNANLDDLTGNGVYYGTSVTAAHALTGLAAAVVGAGNSAGQAVLHLARYCGSVHLIVRGPDLGRSMSSYLVDAIAAQPIIQVHLNTEIIDGRGSGRLEEVTIRNKINGHEHNISLASLFVMIGTYPRTGWLPPEVERDSNDFLITGANAASSERWSLARDPHPHETTVPGLFAVGDVRSGSVKRVASAVGEGSVVVSEIHQFLATPQT